MTFFEHQHRARRKTGILVFYFIIAVILIVLSINTLIFLVISMGGSMTVEDATRVYRPLAVYITLGTLLVIFIGSLITSLKLRGGGRAVARMVGARPVNPDTKDINERRLINVVEEMSIASGTPVPEIYILDNEPGINAFVAGLRPTETVLVVTGGALETFDRDELQGVVGHEYSHIFNGDMNINIRLMGVLAGILLIAQGGRFLMRSAGRSRGRGSGQAGLIGLGLFIIGYVGLFFGGLIKASISRQREFLADASSVQFTRNPDGIAGALWKIKQHLEGSLLHNSHSDDISHFCFGESVHFRLSSIMATHPPLEVRIRAIDPGFLARAKSGQLKKHKVSTKTTTRQQEKIPGLAAGFAPVSASRLSESVGAVNTAHLDYAERLHAAIPAELLQAIHGIDSVRNAVYAMVLAGMKEADRNTGLKILQTGSLPVNTDTILALIRQLTAAGSTPRLALINMAIPSLKSLPDSQQSEFLVTLENLIKSDKRYTVFEFALFTILKVHLAESAGRNIREKYFKYMDVIGEINLLISMLARIGVRNDRDALLIHGKIMRMFTNEPLTLVPLSHCTLAEISNALQKLDLLSPLLKKTVIEACADCIIHDGKILPVEAELMQAIAVSLDCPMPPLLE